MWIKDRNPIGPVPRSAEESVLAFDRRASSYHHASYEKNLLAREQNGVVIVRQSAYKEFFRANGVGPYRAEVANLLRTLSMSGIPA